MGYWVARGKYADGTTVEKRFRYQEDGDANLEAERQYELEAWLIERDKECTWYSVEYEA